MELIVEGRQFLSVYLKWKKRKVVVKDKDVESDDAKMSETTVWVADGCDDQAIDMSIASKIDSYILIIVNQMNERQSRGHSEKPNRSFTHAVMTHRGASSAECRSS